MRLITSSGSLGHNIFLSLVVLLHSHGKSCHDSSGGQKLPSPMTGKETLFPCPYTHTCTPRHVQRARPEHTAVIRSHLFWNQLEPAGIFPPVHWLEGISVVSLKRLEMTTEAGPGEPAFVSLMTSGDFTGWQMTDLTSSVCRVLPPRVRLETAVSATIVCERVLNNHNWQ